MAPENLNSRDSDYWDKVWEVVPVNGGGKVGRVGGRLLSIGDQILYRLPSFIGL